MSRTSKTILGASAPILLVWVLCLATAILFGTEWPWNYAETQGGELIALSAGCLSAIGGLAGAFGEDL